MRRAGAIVLAVALVVLIPVPAEAAGWKRPVDPYPDLPSAQFKTWVQTASGPAVVGGYQPGSTGWAEEQAATKAYLASKGYPAPASASVAKVNAVKTGTLIFDSAGTGKAATITTLPKVLTSPAAIARGNAATGAFMAGWAITDGVLAMYTANTGTNPLQGVCHDPPWVQGVVGALYMFSAPDCSLPVQNANDGATVAKFANLSGQRFWLTNAGRACGPNYPVGTSPAWGSDFTGRSVFVVDASGRSEQLVGWGGSALSSWCGSPTTSVFLATQNDSHGSATRFELRDSGGVVFKSANVQTSSGNPTRQMRCSVQWPDGSWSASDSVAYKEPDGIPIKGLNDGCATAWKRKPSSVPAGARPKTIQVDSTDDAGVTTPVQKQTVPEQTPEEAAADADKTGKGLVLWKGTDNCLTWAASCAGWWPATDKGTSTTTDYRCTFGDAAVALAQCYVYEKTFETATDSPTITDPATGDTVKWSSKSDSGNSTDPSTGPSPADECWDEWASAPNPVEWVFHPVQCALVWAFAPRQAKLKEFQDRIDGSWRGSTPGKFAASIAGVGVAFDALGPGNCRGVILPVPKVQQGSFLPAIENRPVLQACPGDFFEPFAPVFFWLITISIGVGGFFIIKRQLDRLVNN